MKIICANSATITQDRYFNMLTVEQILDQVFPIVSKYSGVSRGRHAATTAAVKYTIENYIPGDYVECGVFRSASVMNMALTSLHCDCRDRKIYLYDTFEGMPDTTDKDGLEAKAYVEKFKAGDVHGCQCDEDIVRKNIYSTGYPEENFKFRGGPR